VRVEYKHLYADTWRLIPEEATWLKPRENWDPKLVWVLRSFLANQRRWDNKESNPQRNAWFKYWSPRFYVVVNDEIIATETGVNGWTHGIEPLLAKLTGVAGKQVRHISGDGR